MYGVINVALDLADEVPVPSVTDDLGSPQSCAVLDDGEGAMRRCCVSHVTPDPVSLQSEPGLESLSIPSNAALAGRISIITVPKTTAFASAVARDPRHPRLALSRRVSSLHYRHEVAPSPPLTSPASPGLWNGSLTAAFLTRVTPSSARVAFRYYACSRHWHRLRQDFAHKNFPSFRVFRYLIRDAT
ncbi:hypothetical protein LIA77_03525 [Sarocladium implicatum]|nr:hypothetical protein LIA77_03525 [Sarocladium implicatum]